MRLVKCYARKNYTAFSWLNHAEKIKTEIATQNLRGEGGHSPLFSVGAGNQLHKIGG